MRSSAPGRYPIETNRNVFLCEPNMSEAEQKAARELYDGAMTRVTWSFMGGAVPFIAAMLIDVHFYSPGIMDFIALQWIIFAVGASAGFILGAHKLNKSKARLNSKHFASFKVQLTKRQLGEFLILESEWTPDTAKHGEIWAWAKVLKRGRHTVPSDLFVLDKSSV